MALQLIMRNARRQVRLASLTGVVLTLAIYFCGAETAARQTLLDIQFTDGPIETEATLLARTVLPSELGSIDIYALPLAVGLLLLIGTVAFLRHRANQQRLRIQAAAEERAQNLDKANRELSALYQKTKASDQAKSAFLASVSREMRTPLNAIIGPAQLLQADITEEWHASFLRIIQGAGERLLQLTDEILQYTSLGTPDFRPGSTQFNLRVRIDEIVNSMKASADEKGLELSRVFEPDLAEERFGDPRLITQVIVNLVESSIKYTDSGRICIAARQDPSSESNDSVLIEVSSTGIGISARECERIFEPFYRSDSSVERGLEGTGLGLAICRQLVELMQGQIGLRIATGGEAVFWLTLPHSGKIRREERIEEPTVAQALDLESKTVLLVDDNHSNIMVESAMLERMDLRIDVATNGHEAIEMASDTIYDLILMDLRMPGINGVEAATRIRSHGPNRGTPIVALSAYLSGQMIEQCDAAGIDHYLSKPVTCSELERTVGLCLDPG